MEDKSLYTLPEAAKKIGVKYATLYHHANRSDHKPRPIEIGRARVYTDHDLIQLSTYFHREKK